MTVGEVLKNLTPETGVPVGVVAVYAFMDEDADMAYGFYYDGDLSVLEAVGYLEAMKRNLLRGAHMVWMQDDLNEDEDS